MHLISPCFHCSKHFFFWLLTFSGRKTCGMCMGVYICVQVWYQFISLLISKSFISPKIQTYPQKVKKKITTTENILKSGLSGACRTGWKTKTGEWGLGIWWKPWQKRAQLRSQHKQLGSECSHQHGHLYSWYWSATEPFIIFSRCIFPVMGACATKLCTMHQTSGCGDVCIP